SRSQLETARLPSLGGGDGHAPNVESSLDLDSNALDCSCQPVGVRRAVRTDGEAGVEVEEPWHGGVRVRDARQVDTCTSGFGVHGCERGTELTYVGGTLEQVVDVGSLITFGRLSGGCRPDDRQ